MNICRYLHKVSKGVLMHVKGGFLSNERLTSSYNSCSQSRLIVDWM